MLDRLQKRVGHGREREVGDGRGEMEKYQPPWTASDRVSY